MTGLRSTIDQMGRSVRLSESPRRIISLVPSQTELLATLGLEDCVVGITRFCIHPESWHRTKTRVGGTKDPDLSKIFSLQPDLIIGNKEENSPDSIRALEREFPVWISDICSFGDALQMIESVGEITGQYPEASLLAAEIRDRFSQFAFTAAAQPPRSVLYLIWREPWMAAGNNTFIHAMLQQAGWLNVAGHLDRYPALPLRNWADLRPEFVFLSSEPYPFAKKHLDEIRDLFPESEIRLVDGEMFSWYGSRLLHAPAYFESLIRPTDLQH